MPLTDSYGRTLSYLRISLTDRCNFRCHYCMPPEGVPLFSHDDMLRIEEIDRLARIFSTLGVSKIRLTGGEPLLRKKIVALVDSLSHMPGIRDIALTTNGSRLAELAKPLKEAGLTSVNVSLDSVERHRFSTITQSNCFDDVITGIDTALSIGLPLKLNVVALSDLTREEVARFCQLAMHYPIEVRFIEFMPLCGQTALSVPGLPVSTLTKWIWETVDLIPLPRHHDAASVFSITGGKGKIGLIASMTAPFCNTCNRIRLTASGALRLCLFSSAEIDLRTPLRDGTSDEAIAALISQAAWFKPKGHEEIRRHTQDHELPIMRSIGG